MGLGAYPHCVSRRDYSQQGIVQTCFLPSWAWWQCQLQLEPEKPLKCATWGAAFLSQGKAAGGGWPQNGTKLSEGEKAVGLE